MRIPQHFEGNGSKFTKLYKPLYIKEIVPLPDSRNMREGMMWEDNTVIKYMFEYGFQNVRGGSYCKIKMNKQ